MKVGPVQSSLADSLQAPHLSTLLSKAKAIVAEGNGPMLKIHAGLAHRALHTGRALGFGLWCFARAIDARGVGRLTRAELAAAAAPYFSPDRLKRAFADARSAGLIRVTRRYKDNKQIIELVSLERAALALGAEGLGAFPVLAPAGKLARAGAWKSTLWASWHAGRAANPGAPISRATQRKLTGIAPRTAQRYERRAGVVVKRTYERRAIGRGKHAGRDAMAEERLQGGGAFEIHDKHTGKASLLICKPNIYTLPNARLARRGMIRKVNSVLRAGLLINPGGQQKVKRLRLFFNDAKAASKALKRYERRRDLDGADIPRAVFAFERDTETGAALWRRIARL